MPRPANGDWENGVRLVSVTEALSETKVRRWGGNPAVWENRARIGSAVHNAAAVLDCNGWTWDTAPEGEMDEYDAVSREVEPFVRAWESFRRNENFIPQYIEHSIITISGATKFATTLDRAGLLNGEPALVEIKTPKKAEPYWGVQLAGHELALMCAFGPPKVRPYKWKRYVCQLFSSGKKPYRLIPYEDYRDREVFLQALGLAVWNRNNYGFNP